MMIKLFIGLFFVLVGMFGGLMGVGVSAAFDGNAKVPSVRNFVISQAVAVLFFVLAFSNLEFGIWPYLLSEFTSLCAYFIYFRYFAKYQKA